MILSFDIIRQMSLLDKLTVDTVAAAKHLLITAALHSLRQLGLALISNAAMLELRAAACH